MPPSPIMPMTGEARILCFQQYTVTSTNRTNKSQQEIPLKLHSPRFPKLLAALRVSGLRSRCSAFAAAIAQSVTSREQLRAGTPVRWEPLTGIPARAATPLAPEAVVESEVYAVSLRNQAGGEMLLRYLYASDLHASSLSSVLAPGSSGG